VGEQETTLSDDQVGEFRESFALMDKGAKGKVTEPMLKECLIELGTTKHFFTQMDV